ncbi:hypothetical protein RND71_002904 [Anisodus tanguticus]|uniref:C2H2-type domain-containing protein n=1 Tax=Anisodus tanguticus TaxID=243964 RepID=A0AAE1SVU0_9SOLA|nr:hypothetical protein RND71_002904 [Anisodus tanguticus]
MEEDQDLKFVCKLCDKKFPCGKSLEGHMRSHELANLEKFQPLTSGERRNISKFELGGHSGYGLRENPKKTWRAVDSTSPLPQEKICKQCGKVFQSLKALCGHMACHSEKLGVDSNSDSEADDDDEEEEEEPRLRTTRSKTKRYKKIVVKSSNYCLVNNNSSTVNFGSSSVSEIDEQVQEEVAKSLMILSRDSGNRNGGVNSVVESSDNNSVVLETKSSSTDMKFARKDRVKSVYNLAETPGTKKREENESEDSDSGYFLSENTIAESDVSVDGFHRNGNSKWRKDLTEECEFDDYWLTSYEDKCEPRKRTKDSSYHPELGNKSFKKIKLGPKSPEGSKNIQKKKYECLNCKKTFSSYQGLGGHKPCRRKTNEYLESMNGTGESSLDNDKHRETFSSRKPAAAKIKPKKSKGHECPFCDWVFKSGQALGGHKRSHFLVGNEQNINRSSAAKKDELLDLNLPAPIDDEDDDEHTHLVSW